ncbi:ferredoxin reductase [Mycobacterium sp. MYCO198283]|uniref:ferredoxin reductase n=1 Tax=Mycobacterium sp. MYCO198283 TaxID=2883505 RepID=UPI001E45D5EF|nr:ferredoxin reductase [Mycobacterium sp. MYCO198283]MCG5431601.1 ferredoxin reductase [Mycobacterium sp. MYCO198283]
MSRKTSKPHGIVADTQAPSLPRAKHPAVDALRRLAYRVTTPLLPDDYLHLVNPLWSARELRGRVVEVRRETEDSATLVIRPGWGFTFDYQPGQYIGIGLLIDGRWRWRSYSLTSSPVSGAKDISITVKAMPEGFLSSHLVSGVAPGTVVRLAAPQGNFVMPDPAPPAVLFLTAGSGVTPVMSMLRTLARRDQITDIVHIHSAPTAADVLFADELAALARDHPSYSLRLRLTRTDGRLNLATLDTELPDWRQRQTWACGPAGMLDEAQRVWADAGLADQLHLERFAVAKAVHGAGGTVRFARSGKTARVDGATPLMDAGEQAGVQMPFGCRMGICQSCVVGLTEGYVRDLRTGAEHEPGTRIQTCVSAASGDCVLDV